MSSTTSTEKTMLPDVAAYFAENTDAQKKYNELHQQYLTLRNEYELSLSVARNASDQAYRDWQKVRNDWSKLTESTDPLVKWIGENCSDYVDYAEQILRALPASYEELEKIARDGDWCTEFDRLADRAVEAGVITRMSRTSEYSEYSRWMSRNYTSSGAARHRLAKLVAAEREQAVEEYKAQQAAALEAAILEDAEAPAEA